MSNRLYYDCIIKAAYMAKHFGVKFETEVTAYNDLEDFPDGGEGRVVITSDPIGILLGQIDGDKLYVAKESELIFEARERDAGKVIGMNDLGTFSAEEWQISCITGTLNLDNDLCEIIMRDGKLFFMPEKDAINISESFTQNQQRGEK